MRCDEGDIFGRILNWKFDMIFMFWILIYWLSILLCVMICMEMKF